MPDPIEIRIDDAELQKNLQKLASRTENLRPLMKNIAGIMEDSVEENLKQEGRPDKWQELAKSTIKQRTKKGHWPGRILQISQTGLASSITSKYDNDSAIVGTNKPYAAIHQLGGDAGRGRKVKIPARPYLKLNVQDKKIIISESAKYLN